MSSVAMGTSPIFASDADRWAAVQRRDPAADGVFYYSVKTTGVYCRPSCAARPARRENVSFHDSCQNAEAAGFRPCKRCRPNAPALAERQAEAVADACRLIENSEAAPDLDALAAAARMSRFYFHRVFKRITGLTPKAYASAHRAGRLREELERAATVTQAIYDAGFNSSGRFYAGATRALGMTPGKYRAGGAGTAIRFAIGDCSLGSILVAASDAGICSILLGDDPERLIAELQSRFPHAEIAGGDPEFDRLVSSVVGFVEAPRIGLNLPLDVRGTAFQQRVWDALSSIPPGATVSYSELARRIGAPGSARAVAQACAANQVAVAIPCHRVVRTGGDISGYRWGVARKRALLDREAGQ